MKEKKVDYHTRCQVYISREVWKALKIESAVTERGMAELASEALGRWLEQRQRRRAA